MAGIDRDYWLDFAKDNVGKSIVSRDEAAAKLDEFLSWVWTIYTSIFALASLLGYMYGDAALLICVSQPILVIMLSRFFCKMVSMPGISEKSNADPNVVPEIIEAFQFMVANKKKKLQVAIIATIISMLSLCVALIGYNSFDKDKQLKTQLRELKLQKDIREATATPVNKQQEKNDSIKKLNDYYDLQLQHEIKRKKLECVMAGNQKCIDSLKLLKNKPLLSTFNIYIWQRK